MYLSRIGGASRRFIFGAVLLGVIAWQGQYVSGQIAGPGRIIFTVGNSYSEGFVMTNTDGTNSVNLTDIGSGQINSPSASSSTGLIAFESGSIQITPPLAGRYDGRIFVMNSDGSGVRQITFYPGQGDLGATADYNPVISPDGTRVAFISRRSVHSIQCTSVYDGQTYTVNTNAEVFTVNTDGTNLQQITSLGFDDRCNVNDNYAVAWSAGGTLAINGTRPYTFAHRHYGDGTAITSMVNAVSVGNTPIVYNFTQSTDPALVEPVATEHIAPGFIDWGAGNKIIFHVDYGDPFFANYENSGSIGYVSPGGGLGAASHTLAQDLVGIVGWNGSTDGRPHGGDIFTEIGGVAYSPDGLHIAFQGSSPLNGDAQSQFVFIDSGGNPVRSTQNYALRGYGIAWAAGPAIPRPNRLVFAPDPALVHDGESVRIVPSLLDPQGNVIVRAALWRDHFGSCPTCGFVCDPQHACMYGVGLDVDFTGAVTGNTAIGTRYLCAANAGLMNCGLIGNNVNAVNVAEINASVPSANTNGDGGDAVFTIRRRSAPPDTSFAVDFVTGGTAVRDVDYSLNVVGNSITFPAGQSTIDIRVTPLRAAGGKTVSLSITAPPNSSYQTTPGTDAATVNILDNGSQSTTLSLASVSPASGGNGGVVLSTIAGSNFAVGATVRLTRTGQPDVQGANVNVAGGGRSLTAVLDLNGRTPGQWNVVVTNPGGASAQVVNGFSIEVNKAIRVTAQISGASIIRASHDRSRYDVVYTNNGNTDAFGVLMFISGVARTQCVNVNDANCTAIETPLDDVPDIPGQAPFPAYVRQLPKIVPVDLPNLIGPGIRQVGSIPVLIPRIPAHSSATFRFSMRFTGIVQTTDQQLSVAILPPLVTAVTVPGAASQTVSLVPSDPNSASSDQAILCLHTVIQDALNCALGFIPGEACVHAAVGGIQTVAGVVGNLSLSGSGAINPVSGAQLVGAGLSIATCLVSATPFGMILNVLNCLVGVYDACLTCLGPDACNHFRLHFVASSDPNEKMGMRRFTAENYVPTSQLFYSVGFENEPTATAPAQEVVVTDQLDTAKFDLSTFSLQQISFGDTVVDVPADTKTFSTEVDLRPTKDLLVRVSGGLNEANGLVTWTFTSIDPFTRQPTMDPLAGFLPPDILGTEGRGKVLFTIMPKNGLVSGTQIRNKATITFDLNPPVDTNEWLNTIDDTAPDSSVALLTPAQPTNTFPVSWLGSDAHSGTADYTVYVSDNGGPFTIWQDKTTATSAPFTGEPGHTYAFYSVAEDNAGNSEAPPAVPDTTTFVILGTTAARVAVSGRVLSYDGQGIRGVRITLDDGTGHSMTAISNAFGYYRFNDVQSGGTCILNATARGHAFTPRVVNVNDELTDVTLTALP